RSHPRGHGQAGTRGTAGHHRHADRGRDHRQGDVRRRDRDRDLPRRPDGRSRFGAQGRQWRWPGGDPLRPLPAATARADRRRDYAVAAAHPARPRAAIPDRRPPGMNSAPRRPAAFRVEPHEKPREEKAATQTPRAPRAVKVESKGVFVPAEIDVFEEIDDALAVPPAPLPPRRRSRLGRIFLSAFGALVTIAIGLWVDALIRELFSRADWLGWGGVALVAIAGLSLFAIIARELLALRRLASVEEMRSRAVDTALRNDQKAAGRLVDELAQFVAAKPETAAGR